MNSIAIPRPQGLKFAAWGALVAEQLAQYGILKPTSEAAWKQWASSLLYIPELAVIPSPLGFKDWTTWASRFYETF